ncbi:MAG TPA: peptide-methionine (S)-S-oxide reductase MsrA [Povalibacter sp.]|nr:peptide-methionine (S)-S-oxide reductase MsrA [Povalibacter sp.]
MVTQRILAALAAMLSMASVGCANGESAVQIPAPQSQAAAPEGLETAVLAGGCFWGVEGVYEHVRGVRNVVSGYAGGDKDTAHYEAVSSGRTGHAEAVQITFDPREISYGEILRIFFSVVHDPTQLNRQGPDTGTQYRSNIFYTDATQQRIATDYITQLNATKLFPRPIVTRVDPLKGFYAAEAYHQDFIAHNPSYPYVVFNDLPKIRNLKQLFPDQFRDGPQVRGAARR